MAELTKIMWNLPNLVENTDMNKLFLAKLVENKILSEDLLRNIQKKEKNNKFPYSIFMEIDKKGKDSVTKLVDILIETGNVKSAKLLDNKRKSVESHIRVSTVDQNSDDSEYNINREDTKKLSLITRINAVSDNMLKQQGIEPPDIQVRDFEEPDILKVNVIKATEYFIDQVKIYNMRSEVKGLAVILNNEEFTLEEEFQTRKGSQVDVKNLSALFQQLGFSVVILQNQTRSETLKYLIDFSSNSAHMSADMMVFCMSTHGPERGKLMSSDCLEIDIEKDILRRFTNDNCPDLRGKPKFFIFQACQGQDTDYGVELKRGNTDCYTDARPWITGAEFPPPSSPLKDPAWEDMLIAYATLPGFVSYRDHVRGTWFIESLCKVLMKQSCDTNLRDMLDEVARLLKKYQTEMGAKQSFKYEVIHFYKKLFFHPGLPATTLQ